MQFKDDTIDVRGIRAELIIALMVAESTYQAMSGQGITITSVTDGEHSKTSLHYSGCAVDIRNPEAFDNVTMAASLKARLFDDYDVIDEVDHIHIEYQPRNGR